MDRYDHASWWKIALYAAIILFGLFRGIFAGQDVAIRTLEAQGYSNIQVVDHSWLAVGLRGCGGYDAARFTVKAINPAGKPSEVYVCTGVFFKGGTVRVW